MSRIDLANNTRRIKAGSSLPTNENSFFIMIDAGGKEQSRITFTDTNIVYSVDGKTKWVK